MNPELLRELGKLSTGVICALGLIGALYIIHEQNETIEQLMQRQTAALEKIADTYAPD